MKNKSNQKLFGWVFLVGFFIYLFSSGDMARAIGVTLIIPVSIGLLLLKDKLFLKKKK